MDILGHQLQFVGNNMFNFSKIKKIIQANQIPLLIFFGLSIALSLVFPTGFSIRYAYQLDDIATEPIIAPIEFGILKTEQKYEQDLDVSVLQLLLE